MLLWCQTGTLYKGLFILILALIVLEYLFGSIIETRHWDLVPPYNATRVQQLPEKTGFQHHPLIKALIGINSNTANNSNGSGSGGIGDGGGGGSSVPASPLTIRNYNSSNSNNLTLLEAFATNYTASLGNTTNLATYFENYDEQPPPETTDRSNPGAISVCPELAPNLRGRLPIVKSPIPTVLELEKRFSWLKPGGHSYPETCRALKRVAIIVPFRCRGEHLLIFLQHMHPLLRKQQLDYTIFVVEQEGSGTFNRAMLMNIGFKEALKINHFDCFIFHDVDLLPEDDRNLYSCPEQPRHMSVAVNIFKYKLPYTGIFGGVSAITTEHFRLLNGFSNSFWGWGGEDDDMSNRIRYHKLHISRYPITVARYTMLTHKKDKPSPNRYELLKSGQRRFDTDGLNSLKYNLKELKYRVLYTWLLVELKPPS